MLQSACRTFGYNSVVLTECLGLARGASFDASHHFTVAPLYARTDMLSQPGRVSNTQTSQLKVRVELTLHNLCQERLTATGKTNGDLLVN